MIFHLENLILLHSNNLTADQLAPPAFVIHALSESIIAKLALRKISIFLLVYVAW